MSVKDAEHFLLLFLSPADLLFLFSARKQHQNKYVRVSVGVIAFVSRPTRESAMFVNGPVGKRRSATERYLEKKSNEQHRERTREGVMAMVRISSALPRTILRSS